MASDKPTLSPAPPAASPRSLRILVVEDDKVDRMALRRALARTGLDLTVTEANSVIDAIHRLAVEPFDCVLLDYGLPDGDGLTFLRGLRGAGISLSAIIITGQQNLQVAGELLAAGATDYIQKAALTTERLTRSLEQVLSRRGATKGEAKSDGE